MSIDMRSAIIIPEGFVMKKDKNELLQDIDEKLYKLTSIRWNIGMSLLRGVATAIGATVVAAIVLAWLNWFLETANEVPVLDTLIERSGIQRTLENEF